MLLRKIPNTSSKQQSSENGNVSLMREVKGKWFKTRLEVYGKSNNNSSPPRGAEFTRRLGMGNSRNLKLQQAQAHPDRTLNPTDWLLNTCFIAHLFNVKHF